MIKKKVITLAVTMALIFQISGCTARTEDVDSTQVPTLDMNLTTAGERDTTAQETVSSEEVTSEQEQTSTVEETTPEGTKEAAENDGIKISQPFTSYYRYWNNCVLVAENDQDGNKLYGMVDLDGNEVIPCKYIGYLCYDKSDTITFVDQDNGYVYNKDFEIVREYERSWEKPYTSPVDENGAVYEGTTSCFNEREMCGMRIILYTNEYVKTDENGNRKTVNERYVDFYNSESGELIAQYQLTDYYSYIFDADSEGNVCVLAENPVDRENYVAPIDHYDKNTVHNYTLYTVNKDGVQMEKNLDMNFDNDYVNRRYFISAHMIWGYTIQDSQRYLTFVSRNTGEAFILPDSYRVNGFNVYDFQDVDGETYCGIRLYNDELYKIVKLGDYEELSEQIYQWINFDDKYIIAGDADGAYIYEYGTMNELARYVDIGAPFNNGRTLVYDGTGVYFINDNLEQISDYILTNKDGRILGCGSNVIKVKADNENGYVVYFVN